MIRHILAVLMARRIELVFIFVLGAFALWYALSGFLVRPALWFDEGITLEIARNFILFGQLDVLTAPETFSGVGYLVGTNGFPVTVPIALVYKIFGIGLLQARVVMLLWMCAALLALYGVSRKLFSVPAAVSAMALSVTFATLYADGLTATGEMPGLFFFFIGIWFLAGKKDYFWTGIFWGLAMAAKPGVFLLLAHTTVLYILLFDRTNWFKKLFTAGFGFLIPVVAWVLLAFPLTPATFYSILAYVLNPIDLPFINSFLQSLPVQTYEGVVVSQTTSATDNFAANLRLFVTSSTLIYFSLLAAVVALGLYLGRSSVAHAREALGLFAVYGSLVVFFFLRGPGWFRYLFGLQILILVLLYPALQGFVAWARARFKDSSVHTYLQVQYLPIVICALCFLQFYQLLYLSDIKRSSRPVEVIAYAQGLLDTHPNATIGIYNVPVLAAFTDAERTYHISQPHVGAAPLGESPLLMETPPDILVITKARLLVGESEDAVLGKTYTLLSDTGILDYDIYMKNVTQ
jgi:hypothetical protein